jgi:hypothetical protein
MNKLWLVAITIAGLLLGNAALAGDRHHRHHDRDRYEHRHHGHKHHGAKHYYRAPPRHVYHHHYYGRPYYYGDRYYHPSRHYHHNDRVRGSISVHF